VADKMIKGSTESLDMGLLSFGIPSRSSNPCSQPPDVDAMKWHRDLRLVVQSQFALTRFDTDLLEGPDVVNVERPTLSMGSRRKNNLSPARVNAVPVSPTRTCVRVVPVRKLDSEPSDNIQIYLLDSLWSAV